jgi:hypothetical protein
MNRGQAVLAALLVLGVGLVARIATAAIVVFPKPEDTAYYVEVARALLDGRGLVADALWSYQTPPLVLPRPAFEVWLPLPSFLAAIPMALFGPTFASAQIFSVLVGAIVPVLAWRLAADVALERGLPEGRARMLSLGAGLTSAVYLPLLLHSALPDSTMLFTALALGACLLMPRITRDPRAARLANPQLLGLGLLIGLAALTRNEAAWIGLVWLIVCWRIEGISRRDRLTIVAVPAVLALAIFLPWAYRDWVVFGNPLPGQALSNALSISGSDIFAWNDPPTLSRYLSVGPARLLEMRLDGTLHNLLNVLLFPGAPVSFIGLAVLPWFARLRALRPLVLLGVITFLVTSLVFPVSTTWGTFLHAAGPIHVLLVVCAVAALDVLIAAVGRRRGWTRPVAWLGPALTVSGALLFGAVLLPTFGRGSRDTADRYRALEERMSAIGMPLLTIGPVITDYPIWLSMTSGAPALALPDESPRDVLDLAAAFPGTRTLVIHGGQHQRWPAILNSGAPGAECFEEVDIGRPADPRLASALAGTRVFLVVCP